MITINKREINYEIGMTVADALKEAGELVDSMTLVAVDGKVVPKNLLNSELISDGACIKLLRIIAGG
jgi:thiamine biosynthesis protein ThiS